MLPLLLAIAGGYLIADSFKKNNTEDLKKITKEKKEEESDWRDDLKMYENKEGFDYAINEFSGDVDDAKFKELKKNYVDDTKRVKRYIKTKDLKDDKYDSNLNDAIDKEGFDYALNGYNDWKGIKDDKFQELYSAYKKSRKTLSEYIGIDK